MVPADPTPGPDGRPPLPPGAVIVEAWGPWCTSCRAQRPRVAAIAGSRPDGPSVRSLQVDAEPELADALGIRSVPTLIALSDGVEVGRLVGAQADGSIAELFDRATGPAGPSVRSAPPRALAVLRLLTGLLLVAAGLVTTVVLAAVGAAVAGWGIIGLVRSASTPTETTPP